MPYANQALIRMRDPTLADALDSIFGAAQSVASQTAASTSGVVSPPSAIAAVSVVAADGVFDVQIQDNSPVIRGINYFLEYSTTPNFAQPHVVDMGASRTYRATWGSQTLYFRAYSQYPTSNPSPTVYFGTQAKPVAVVGGGTAPGPTPQPSTGSGTASGNGQGGGSGFGSTTQRGRDLVA